MLHASCLSPYLFNKDCHGPGAERGFDWFLTYLHHGIPGRERYATYSAIDWHFVSVISGLVFAR
jgi:hypothetical protein